MAKHKVDDKVTIRQWDDMEKQYGLSETGDILPAGESLFFPADFKVFCGKEFTVDFVDHDDGTYNLRGCILTEGPHRGHVWFADEFFVE